MTAISRHLSIVSNNCRRGAALSEEIRHTTARLPPNASPTGGYFWVFLSLFGAWDLGFGISAGPSPRLYGLNVIGTTRLYSRPGAERCSWRAAKAAWSRDG